MEEYLIKLTRNIRIQVTKFRTCNNKLPVVTGKYQGVVREDRICKKCDAGLLGDEYHVLCQYNQEKIVRLCSMYMPGYYSLTPSYHKYVLFMQNNTVKVLKNLTLFLRSVFSLFR